MSSSLRIAVSLSLVCAACASGATEDDTDARRIDAAVIDGTPPIDTPPAIDAPIDTPQPIDAPIDTPQPIDAAVDAPPVPIDAAVDAVPIDAPIDAPATCTPGTTQLLVNANLDGAPTGTGWSEVLIDPLYTLITSDTLPALTPNTAPNHAWLGGFDTGGSDSMDQLVTVPAGTTQLVLRGVRHTVTNETTTSTVYDSSHVSLNTPVGAVLEAAATFTNLTATTSYTPFTKTFTTPHAGETVRVHFDSSGDGSLATNFFYDSLALDAIVVCP